MNKDNFEIKKLNIGSHKVYGKSNFKRHLVKSFIWTIIAIGLSALIYFRGNVLWFALIHADEVTVAQDSYNSYHKEATEAYKARLKGNVLTATESSKNE